MLIGITFDRQRDTVPSKNQKRIDANALGVQYFGSRFLDIHPWLVNYALDWLNITPTEQDSIDISNDMIPSSLLGDDVHFNENGKKAVAHCVEERLKLLGY